MKWQECTNDNTQFTTRYDSAVRQVRAKLGSYDTIAHLIFQHAGQSVAGVSVRRWLRNRNLPITLATTLVDLMEGEVVVGDFYPYLEGYFEI